MSDSPFTWSHEDDPPVGGSFPKKGHIHGARLCEPRYRYAAAVIDWVGVWGIPFLIIQNFTWIGGVIAGFIAAGFNSGYLLSETGQSIGKKVFGIYTIQVLRRPEGWFPAYVPLHVALLRMFIHVLDIIPPYIQVFTPVWHPFHATIADIAAKTYNFRDKIPQPVRSRGWVSW